MAYLRVNDVSFSQGNTLILNKVSIDIARPLNVAIVGSSASGKSTLLKLLNGNHFGEGEIIVKDTQINLENFRTLKRVISVVFDDDIFIKDYVFDELRYPLTNLVMRPSDIDNMLAEVVTFFGIENLLDWEIEDLSVSDRMLVKILTVLITNPSVIGFDDVIGYLDEKKKVKLFKYLKKKGINFILVTSDMEEVLYADYLICMYNGMIAMEGETLGVLKEEKLLRRLGLNLPFYVDLSIQLGYYELLSDIYMTKEEMVKAIWK